MRHYLDIEKAVGDVDLRPAVYIGDSMTEGMRRNIQKYYAQRGVPVLVLDKRGSQSKGWHEVFTSKRPRRGWQRRIKAQYDTFMLKNPSAQFNIGSLGGNAWPTARKGPEALTDYSNKYTRFLFNKVKDTGGIVGGTTTSGARGSRFKSAHTGTDSHDDLKGLVNTQYSKLAKEVGVPYYDARSAQGSEAWRPPKGAVHPKWSAYKKMATSRMAGQQSLSNQAYSAPMTTADARTSTAKLEAPTQSMVRPENLESSRPMVATRPTPTRRPPPTQSRGGLLPPSKSPQASVGVPTRKSLWLDADIYKGRRGPQERGKFLPRISGGSGLRVHPDLQYKIEELVAEASKKYNVPESIILSHIWTESRMKPKAVSRTGAVGLMQLMPSVQKQYGIKDPYDLKQNIMGGTRLLSSLKRRVDRDPLITSNKWKAVAGMYFAGPRGAGKRIVKYHPNVLDQSKTIAREKRRVEGLDRASEELGLPKPSEKAPSKPVQDDWYRRMSADTKARPHYISSTTGEKKPRATKKITDYMRAIHDEKGLGSRRPTRQYHAPAPMTTADARTSTGTLEAPTHQSMARPEDLAPQRPAVATKHVPAKVNKSLFQIEYFIEV